MLPYRSLKNSVNLRKIRLYSARPSHYHCQQQHNHPFLKIHLSQITNKNVIKTIRSYGTGLREYRMTVEEEAHLKVYGKPKVEKTINKKEYKAERRNPTVLFSKEPYLFNECTAGTKQQ
eukprot:Pgem_evm1s15975